MTNRERVIAALEFDRPDRTPYTLSLTGQMLQKMIGYTGRADYMETVGNHISDVYLIKPERTIKPDFVQDEFGVVWNRSGVDKDIGVIDHPLIGCPGDLDSYQMPEVDEAYIRSSMERMLQNCGGNFRVAAIGFSMFERAWTLTGMENLLVYMLEEPEFVHELMNMICERNLRILDIALQYPIDCFHFGDDWGQQNGLIMGPTHWREFIKPYVARMYARVHQAGKYVSQHSCGDIRPVMDDLLDIGLNMYQTYQPEIYGLEYAQNLKGKLTIWGGISTQRELPYCTPDEVRALTRRLIAAFPEGGLVASPTHSVPGDVPPENIEAMVEVFKEG